MKKIIGNLLYDTEKAEKIYSYRVRRKTGSIGALNFYNWFDINVYKTKKDNYFIYGCPSDEYKYSLEPFIEEFSEPEFKEILKKIDPDKYTEFGFDDIEEA
ncbi:MAG: hypothetical protein ACLRT4_04320 [Thomasclavelia sp.]